MKKWRVIFHTEFAAEHKRFPETVQNELYKKVKMLEDFGVSLGRPHADTLKGSKYSNMKELRFNAENGAWRAAFAFDPERRAVVFVAGDKTGQTERLFYRRLIVTADGRYDRYLAALKAKGVQR